MSVHIVDDEQRGDRPRPPSALRVAAGRPRLLCRSSSTMRRGIAVVVASRIRGRRARHIRGRICELGYLACTTLQDEGSHTHFGCGLGVFAVFLAHGLRGGHAPMKKGRSVGSGPGRRGFTRALYQSSFNAN
jgi:hypothetical protein